MHSSPDLEEDRAFSPSLILNMAQRKLIKNKIRYNEGLEMAIDYVPLIHAFDQNLTKTTVCVCVCVCVFSSHPFWTSSSLDVPAGVTQEEGHTGFLIHLPSAVRALIFVARRIQPFLSLVDREVEFCVLTN